MTEQSILCSNSDEYSFKAMGGTELQRKWLYEHVDNKLLSKFQIISSRVRELDGRPAILWLHDRYNDKESVHLKYADSRARFRKLLFVSNWQFTTYNVGLGVPYQESYVMRNAIKPIQEHTKPSGKIRLIYHTTPHRGLQILLPVFNILCQQYDLHLDVYSSFKIYGWEHQDIAFEPLFDMCREHPNITYHGFVSNDEIRAALLKAHIFAYPSIWAETSCIAALEALSAKVLVVTPNFAALPETTAGFGWTYPFEENQQAHAHRFYHAMKSAIEEVRASSMKQRLHDQKVYIDKLYDWKERAREWTTLLNELANS